MKRKNSIGMRVRLTRPDRHAKLKRGDEGVVTDFDGSGTLFVKWDNGAELNIRSGGGNWVPVEHAKYF